MLYDRTKAEGQRRVLAAVERGLDAVILNPTAVVGPHDFGPSSVGEAILSLARGRLPALINGGFDWVDVRDVTRGALAAERQGLRGQSYILSGHRCEMPELARMIERVTGVKAPGFISPVWLARAGAPFVGLAGKIAGKRPLYTAESLYAIRHHRIITSQKAARELGYRVRPLSETIQDTIQWFEDTGRLQGTDEP
jgi:dihydroflavonol-4-reductase